MKMKKWLSVVAGLSMFGLMACGDDSGNDNPVNPPSPEMSSTENPQPASSTTEPVATSSSAGAPMSSSAIVPNLSSADESNNTFVTVTEIMYNAPDKSELEWIELTIQSGPDLEDMEFYRLRLEGAVTFEFPGEPLKAKEFIVVTNNPTLFKQTYPDFKGRLFGPWDNDPKTGVPYKLVNEGDVIDVKITGKGDISAAFSNEPPWPSLANGNGRTLVFMGGNPAQPSAWGASAKVLGNPGSGDDLIVAPSSVRLNEIKPYVLGASDGWVELYNKGTAPVDVAGWELESKLKKKTWKIGGANTTVPAGGFLLLDATAAVFGEDLYLSDKGGEFYLYEVVGGARTGIESSLMLAASTTSSGVVDVSDGSVAQGALASETPGAANAPLKVGPIFITELHYHPVDADPNDVEFMELVNKGTTDVNLYVTKDGMSKGWKIEGVNKEFASGDVFPAGAMMLLFPDSLQAMEADLRTRYAIDPAVLIKFYKGKLSNRGETIAVKEPYSHVSNDTGVQWYYGWSDATLYSDGWSEPDFENTDGFGYSLQRADFTTMGYEAKAWKAAAPTPGKL